MELFIHSPQNNTQPCSPSAPSELPTKGFAQVSWDWLSFVATIIDSSLERNSLLTHFTKYMKFLLRQAVLSSEGGTCVALDLGQNCRLAEMKSEKKTALCFN